MEYLVLGEEGVTPNCPGDPVRCADYCTDYWCPTWCSYDCPEYLCPTFW